MSSPFIKSVAVSLVGTSVSIMEMMRGASLVLVIVGGLLSAGGGWYAFRLKRLEFLREERDYTRRHGQRRR